MSEAQIAWARGHDWFVSVDASGVITVSDRYSDGFEVIMEWHLTFAELRAWAGY